MSDLERHLHDFEQNGFFIIPQFFELQQIQRLQQRIDEIMLGQAELDYEQIWMQQDTDSGKYEELSWGGNGFQGATLAYRKIQGLEVDERFRTFITSPVFVELCRRVYGPELPIAAYRTMFMNKAAGQGTWLPWHQDRWTHLDQDPLLTVWIPLDVASRENGCVQIIKGSHHKGLINPEHSSGFLTEAQAAMHAPAEDVVYLTAEPGDLVVLHNLLLHASDVNRTAAPRRALSVCYMDGNTRNIEDSGVSYPVLFRT
jgi:phytanoyl-CoA hydroxylase